MAWEFETDPEFQAVLDWAADFVHEEVEPADLVVEDPFDRSDSVREAIIPPLQHAVRAKGLWAVHLGPELGGHGFGQVKLGLLNEILGGSKCAPVVFGCQAPDTGNAEVLAHYGSPELKARYLEPLLAGDVFSCFSMTEPQGGSDPTAFTTSAVLDGGEWVINGEKWMSTNARHASFFVVMAVSEPDNPPHQRASMFVVPAETPGVEIVRNVGLYGEAPGHGHHGYVRYTDVRIPRDHLLGDRGGGFVVSQVRLGGGRVHHAMRTVGQVRRALDLMCERAISRQTKGETLARKQLVQEMIAESWLAYQQLRILVLQTAWKIDRYEDYKRVRGDIAAIKILAPRVLHDVAVRAVPVHGALGVTDEMPLGGMIMSSLSLGLADGASEVHKVTLSRQVVSDYRPASGLFPTGHLPARRAAAEQKYADVLSGVVRAPDGGSPVPTMRQADVIFDVSGALKFEAAIVGSVYWSDERAPSGSVVVAVPGGTYTRSYWHPNPHRLPGYSMCEYLTARGVVVVAIDNIGTGSSTRPTDPDVLTPDLMAQGVAAVAAQVRAHACDGTLAGGLVPMEVRELIGVGHSLGGLITVVQQADHESYDRIAVLGYPVLGDAAGEDDSGERLQLALESMQALAPDTFDSGYLMVSRDALRDFFYGPYAADDVIAADAAAATVLPRQVGAAATMYGHVHEAARRIDVPVFVAFGEQDLSPDPEAEGRAYISSSDVEVFVLADSAHCHNFAPSRAHLWDALANWIATPVGSEVGSDG